LPSSGRISFLFYGGITFILLLLLLLLLLVVVVVVVGGGGVLMVEIFPSVSYNQM